MKADPGWTVTGVSVTTVSGRVLDGMYDGLSGQMQRRARCQCFRKRPRGALVCLSAPEITGWIRVRLRIPWCRNARPLRSCCNWIS